MPIVKEPTPMPSELGYVPDNTKAHKVSTSDSWWTLAELPEVKAAGMTANDLCYLNFKTRNPAEINWYLRNKVGCLTTTADGKNYRFSNADSPGIVYLPRPGKPPAATDVKPDKRTNVWIGLGANAGTQFVLAGIDTMSGPVFSIDEFGKAMLLTASTSRLGPGFGASGGISVIVVSGVTGPRDLNGHLEGGWDYNVSIGDKFDSVTKTTKFTPFVKLMQKIGNTPSAVKRLLMNPGNWADFSKAAKGILEGMDVGTEPKVVVIGIPFAGAGAEVSVFHGVSEFHAVWDNQ